MMLRILLMLVVVYAAMLLLLYLLQPPLEDIFTNPLNNANSSQASGSTAPT
jgi:hypothetical protein